MELLLLLESYLLNQGSNCRISGNHIELMKGYKSISYIYPVVWRSWRSGKWPYPNVEMNWKDIDYVMELGIRGDIWVIRRDLKFYLPIPEKLIGENENIVESKDLIELPLNLGDSKYAVN